MSNPTGDTSFEDAVLAWQEKYVVRINRPNSKHEALEALVAAHTAALRHELEALHDKARNGSANNSMGWVSQADIEARIAALTNPQEGR